MIVYTDGSFTKNPNIAGYGAVIITKNGTEHQIGGYSQKCADNNTAEVYAIASALKYIIQNNLLNKEDHKLCIIMTDSQYAINHIDAPNRNEYEGQCYAYIREVRKHCKMDFFWIKGHVHDGTKVAYYNNLCDQIATESRLRGLEKIENETRFVTALKKKKSKNR